MPARGRSGHTRGDGTFGNGHAASDAPQRNGHGGDAGSHGRAARRAAGQRRRGNSAFVAPAHVVITGAAGAIGAAIAREMRTRWPGVHLALVDRDAVGLAATAAQLSGDGDGRAAPLAQVARDGGGLSATAAQVAPGAAATRTAVSTYAADLRDIARLGELVDRIEQHAPIDGLVNCAGIMRIRSLAGWDWNDAAALLDIDFTAPLYLQQRIAPRMIERGRGVLVNVASMAGRVPLKGGTYYCAAKAGLAMASEIARAELAGHGIRVVTVYPGPVKSALEQGARDDYGGAGLFGRMAPTGQARSLARKIVHALEHDEPRVIYPRVYGMGWTAPNLSSWITLSYGPPPVR